MHITVPARAENVALIRHAVAGFAEQMGMAPERIGDLKTVVTEAGTNVVQHAYDTDEGPLEVSAEGDATQLPWSCRTQGGEFGHALVRSSQACAWGLR